MFIQICSKQYRVHLMWGIFYVITSHSLQHIYIEYPMSYQYLLQSGESTANISSHAHLPWHFVRWKVWRKKTAQHFDPPKTTSVNRQATLSFDDHTQNIVYYQAVHFINTLYIECNALLKGLRMVDRALWRSEARRVVPWSETLHEP